MMMKPETRKQKAEREPAEHFWFLLSGF